jgi:3-deoxy-D-manno-octulosonic-acid transferase
MESQRKQTDIGMLHKVYRVATCLAIPGVALGLLTSKRGRARYGERFGRWSIVEGTPWWFHGASVGEVQGLIPLLKRMREELPTERILLTGTSVTGLERGAPLVDDTRLIPLDSHPLVARALKNVSPARFIISETELWPELISQVQSSGVPVSIVNGRISDYTFAWYRRLRSLFGALIEGCATICVPDTEQEARFLSMGARPSSVLVTGHTKYDSEPRCGAGDQREALRQRFFPGVDARTAVLVLGSLRPQEESWWLDACQRVWGAGGYLRVILVPRHLERVEHFTHELERRKIPFEQWSNRARSAPEAQPRVLVLDTMGLLEEAYAAGDLAFIGATLVDIGGHNPLEPAMYGVPVCVGPYTSVIRTIVDEMEAAGGVIRVSSAADISTLVDRLVRRDDTLKLAGEAGKRVWARHRGAAKRVFDRIVGV